MQRINNTTIETATPVSSELLKSVKGQLGMVPNLYAALGNSPTALQVALQNGAAQEHSALTPAFREKIALVVAQTNSCDYCLSAHTTIGKMNGLTEDETIEARRGKSSDHKEQIGLQFAIQLVDNRGNVSNEQVGALKTAGYSDQEILDVANNVLINIYTNYMNHLIGTVVDFPAVRELELAR
ncbi:MAG: carboxymuconolactone decarboxylase family protein [Fimbriimonadaceae bacterium]